MKRSIWLRKTNLFLLLIPVVRFPKEIGLEQFLHEVLHFPVEPVILVLAALALIPLAGFLESAVEELSELTNQFIGGFLHTTFTNVAELSIMAAILFAFGPDKGPPIVLSAIAGVVIRNSLLFLGFSTLAGCWKNGKMRFNAEKAGEYSTVFALAIMGLGLPTLAYFLKGSAEGAAEGAAVTTHVAGAEPVAPGDILIFNMVPLGVVISVALLIIYLGYVGYSIFHIGRGKISRAMEVEAAVLAESDRDALFEEERAQAQARTERLEQTLHPKMAIRQAAREEGEGEPESRLPRPLRWIFALLTLGIATAGVVTLSEQFAHAAEELATNQSLHRFEFLLGLVIIPIVGGMVELYGTTAAARENRMELVMALTAGATIQMALFVVPVLAIVGFAFNHPLPLVFKPIEIILFGASTFTFMLLSRDGESSLLEGVQLVALWALLAIIAAFLPPA